MSSLFDFAYPNAPGWKEATTSRAAADNVASETSRLRRKVLAALREGPATADEVAERIGETVLSTRPRLTELQHLKQVRDTGLRGINASGRKAKIFELMGETN